MPTTTKRPLTFKPDAFFHRKGASNPESCSHYDIAFTVEFKKVAHFANFADDVVYAMKHIMAVDARRRFVFGITIENTSMALWFANRSMLVGSERFDIIENKEYLIRVFMSFAYASDMEMGLDPTVKHLEGDFYHINVGDTKYQTVDKLHDARADVLLSRGVRVFKVKKVDDAQDTFYVLKDIWTEKGRRPEHQIYEDIITDIGLQFSEEDVCTAKQHLLTPVDHSFVKINGVEDEADIWSHTLPSPSKFVALSIHIPAHGPARNSKTHPNASDMEVETDHDIKRTVEDPEAIRYRQHYRIVFKECAQPIHRVTKVKDVFTVLADVIKVFQLIHGSGWVHRDVSVAVGNVYLFDGRGMLGDLEYAKNTSDTSQHDVRTGTIDFMPAEVIRLKYLFRPTQARALGGSNRVEQLPLRYNAIHDLESVWWPGVWMMFFYKPKDYVEPKENSLKRQNETVEVFPGTISFTALRVSYLSPDIFWVSTQEWISAQLSYAVDAFDIVRAKLVELYQEIEGTFPDGLSRLSAKADRRGTQEAFPGGPTRDIYKPIGDIFLKAEANYDERNIELMPLKVSESDVNRSKKGKQTSTPGSRKRESDDGVAEVGKEKGKQTSTPGLGKRGSDDGVAKVGKGQRKKAKKQRGR